MSAGVFYGKIEKNIIRNDTSKQDRARTNDILQEQQRDSNKCIVRIKGTVRWEKTNSVFWDKRL